MPAYMTKLMEAGTLGNKAGRGFFKKDGKVLLALDPKNGDYTPITDIKLPDLSFIRSVAECHHNGLYKQGMKLFIEAKGDEAALARKVIAGYVSYAFHRVGEATNDITGIDSIMGFGFNWAPPSVLVDMIGAAAMVEIMEKSNLPVPQALADAARTGKPARFFTLKNANIGKYFVAG
jgi:3-hydroxyacyl-CoA dehydrogenase